MFVVPFVCLMKVYEAYNKLGKNLIHFESDRIEVVGIKEGTLLAQKLCFVI